MEHREKEINYVKKLVFKWTQMTGESSVGSAQIEGRKKKRVE
jgi:hypothetical protein